MLGRRPLLLALLALVSACSSARGLDRGALAAAVAPPVEVAGLAGLERPFKLAIVLQPPVAPPGVPADQRPPWEWGTSDEDKLTRVGEALERDRIVSDVVFLHPAGTRNPTEIRRLAAAEGADAVLVVSGVADVDRYNNVLGPSYVLLFTPLLVPGTVVDALFVARGDLWDTRDALLYASLEADGMAMQTRPAWMISEERVVALARERALSDLAELVRETLERLRD
ncbi:MAG TPA: hypothetical protein VIS07_23125 [Candidatus Binatia bacterium]